MRRPFSLLAAAVALALACGTLAAAQGAPAPKPAAVVPPVTPATTAPAVPAVPPADTYTYEPQGRRDPFVSLLARGSETKGSQGSKKADGVAGMAVGELSVRGVVKSREGYVALLQGPDNKTYVARAGDRLLDGTIKSITDQGLVILQEVTDPLSLVKQREVRKGLRAFDEGK
jgi:type IV pilus assembly protein PilP